MLCWAEACTRCAAAVRQRKSATGPAKLQRQSRGVSPRSHSASAKSSWPLFGVIAPMHGGALRSHRPTGHAPGCLVGPPRGRRSHNAKTPRCAVKRWSRPHRPRMRAHVAPAQGLCRWFRTVSGQGMDDHMHRSGRVVPEPADSTTQGSPTAMRPSRRSRPGPRADGVGDRGRFRLSRSGSSRRARGGERSVVRMPRSAPGLNASPPLMRPRTGSMRWRVMGGRARCR